MLIVGLTGGIGSGKSTVANLFEKLGTPVIDADVLAREVIHPPEPAFKKLIEHFGESILTETNHIDRTKLRELIFKNHEERIWLENLLHPLIRTRIEQKIASIATPYCIVIIPLLFETGAYPYIKRILVVDTPPHIQRKRVMARDQSSPEQVDNIINAQTTREKRLSGAHDVIMNNGPIEDLMPQVEKLHKLYSSLVLS